MRIYEPKYWLHLLIIAIIALAFMQFCQGGLCQEGKVFTLNNILWAIPILGVADIIAHSILNLD